MAILETCITNTHRRFENAVSPSLIIDKTKQTKQKQKQQQQQKPKKLPGQHTQKHSVHIKTVNTLAKQFKTGNFNG